MEIGCASSFKSKIFIMASTTLMNVDAESTAGKLAEHISQLNEDASLIAEYQVLIDGAQTQLLILKYLEHIDLVCSQDNTKDVEGAVQAIMSMILKLGNEVDIVSFTKLLVDALVSKSDLNVKNRLRSLLLVFNMISMPEVKFQLLTEILNFATLTSQSASVSHFHSHIDEWIVSWKLSIPQRRSLYRLISSLLMAHGQTSLCVQNLVKYLRTFKGEAFTVDAETIATSAVVNAIKSPVSAFSDRNAILESIGNQPTGELRDLLELLGIICTGSIQNFIAFEAAHGPLLSKHDISTTDVKHAVSLLTICSLGTQHALLDYDTISKALNIPADDVELWVVEAMSNDLLDGTIDQSSSTVTISRCAYRSFGPENWKTLQQKLSGMRSKLAHVMESIRKHVNPVNA